MIKLAKEGREINNTHSSLNSNQNTDAEVDAFPGIVMANFGNQVLVQSANNLRYRCPPRNTISQLVAGDKVLIREERHQFDGDLKGSIVAKLPRKNELLRPNAQKKLCPIAANIDFILIVVACAPTPQPELIDRYVVASEASGITPILVLNKSVILSPSVPSYLKLKKLEIKNNVSSINLIVLFILSPRINLLKLP